MNTTITLKTDAETKKAAQELAKDMGLSLSGVINSQLKQFVATRRLEVFAPFPDEQMTPHLEKLIAKVEEERENGKVSKGYDNVEDFLAALKA